MRQLQVLRFLRRLGPLVVLLAVAVPAPAAAGSYTVKWGDTLTGVAKRFGVSVRALADANGLADPNRVLAGRSLAVPSGGTASKAPPAPAAPRVHVVAVGENLTDIAKREGVGLADVLRLNHLANANHIEVGQRLLLPGTASRMLCPVAGFHTAVDGFGDMRPGGHRHEGDDIFAPRGVPVVANVAGVLSHITGAVTGNGYYLRGDDGTVYYGAHLDSYVAAPGRVAAGTVIGRVGNTGDAATTPTHLHFEIKPGGGAPVDPWPVLSRIC